MEEEKKISFFKKIKISIFGLENYQNLATQKVQKTVGYLAKLMLIFAFLLAIALTYQFGKITNNVKQYLENEISELHFENNKLVVNAKENSNNPIVIDNENELNGKLIIDTSDVSEEKINNYMEDVKGYANGIIILKDKIIFKTSMTAVYSNISFADVSEQYNLVKLDKQDILSMLSGTTIYMVFFIVMAIYLFIIYFSTVLIDALLYSLLAYITGMFSRLRLKYIACYNIAVHSLTLPIILNLIYIIVNLLTGYTIKYFDIMYMAITCIYVITSILMIKSDIIKKQIELSKIISEQEKVKQELERKEQEKKEQEEKERLRKEDEKREKEEKEKSEDKLKGKKKKEQREPREDGPQPEANIRTDNF